MKHKPYDGVMLGLQKVALSCSIQVHGVADLTADHLALYFESIEGVDDAEVELFSQLDYALVRFADATGKHASCVFVCYLYAVSKLQLINQSIFI